MCHSRSSNDECSLRWTMVGRETIIRRGNEMQAMDIAPTIEIAGRRS
jgi:hypothetical protein